MADRFWVQLAEARGQRRIASLADIQSERDGGRDPLQLNQKSFWLGRTYEGRDNKEDEDEEVKWD